jgi:hypothetical protein
MEMAEVIFTVNATLVDVAGVVYVEVTTPIRVRPVPKVPEVCAQRADEIWLKLPENLPY